MSENDMARSQSEPGSQAAPEAPTDLRPSGVDPSRAPDLAALSAEATPGPWHFRGNFISAKSTNPCIGGQDVVVSSVAYSDRTHEEDKANLRFLFALAEAYRDGRLIEATLVQGIEARKGRDEGSVHESPVGHEADAP